MMSAKMDGLDNIPPGRHIRAMSTTEFIRRPGYLTPERLTDQTRVRLTAETREDGKLYVAGSPGTIVHVNGGGRAFEVEVTHPMHGVVTVEAGDLEAIAP